MTYFCSSYFQVNKTTFPQTWGCVFTQIKILLNEMFAPDASLYIDI